MHKAPLLSAYYYIRLYAENAIDMHNADRNICRSCKQTKHHYCGRGCTSSRRTFPLLQDCAYGLHLRMCCGLRIGEANATDLSFIKSDKVVKSWEENNLLQIS